MSKKSSAALLAGFVAMCLLVPTPGRAAEKLEISAWIPYWKAEAGVAGAIAHLDLFTEVNPFIYTVTSQGELNQADALTDPEWVQLRQATKQKNVRFIPTVMWGSGESIHAILSNDASRQAHVASIAQQVYANQLDGIDIDYEAKLAETNPYFSLFLKELADAIGYDKWLVCTIESRTPLDSRYETPEDIPADLSYANDLKEINKYCDRVRIMAYDQGRFDIKLNAQKADPYIPVSDTDWVSKVIGLMTADIAPSKFGIGVATYGYEYDMFEEYGDTQYSQLWSFNPRYATDIATKVGVTPVRNSAGEMFVTYPASKSPDGVIPLPNATRVMSWSDAEAVKQKLELARKTGIVGAAIFKVDGGEDQNLWNILPAYALGASALTLKVDSSVPSGTEADQQTNPVPDVADDTPLPSPEPLGLKMPTQNLQYGMRHADVITLQKFLNAKGFVIAASGGGSPGKETTFFGPATKNALIKFQKANKISPAVGFYGPVTRGFIASAASHLSNAR